jgi:hypothetical protein
MVTRRLHIVFVGSVGRSACMRIDGPRLGIKARRDAFLFDFEMDWGNFTDGVYRASHLSHTLVGAGVAQGECASTVAISNQGWMWLEMFSRGHYS